MHRLSKVKLIVQNASGTQALTLHGGNRKKKKKKKKSSFPPLPLLRCEILSISLNIVCMTTQQLHIFSLFFSPTSLRSGRLTVLAPGTEKK